MATIADVAEPPLRITAAVYRSLLGNRRKANEDAVLCLPRVPLFAVADGTGGTEPARTALGALEREVVALIDKNAVVTAEPTSRSRLALARFLEGLFAKANTAVFEAAGRISDRRIATTLCAATLVGRYAFVAHVGDSRAYLLRDGRLRRLTNDHTLGAMQRDHGALGGEALASSPLRHTLAQSLGTTRALEVDLLELRLAPGDLLVITSDGLTRALSEELIGACLMAEGDAETRADRLCDKVAEAGTPDDTSFILIETGSSRAPRRRVDLEAIARSSFLFAPLSDSEWHQVQPYLERIETPTNDLLCELGGEPLGFGVVVEGQLTSQEGANEVRARGPGEHFGALALVSPDQSLETVRTLTPTTLYVLSRPRFYELVRLKPLLGAELTLSLLESLGSTLGLLTTRLGHLIDAANGKP